MKPRLTRLLASLLLSVAIVAPAGISLTGCAAGPDKTALNVVIASRSAAQVAWGTFRTLRAQGKVSDDDWKLGVQAVEAYKASALATLNAIEAFQTNQDKTTLEKALAINAAAWQAVYPVLVKYVPTTPKTPPPL